MLTAKHVEKLWVAAAGKWDKVKIMVLADALDDTGECGQAEGLREMLASGHAPDSSYDKNKWRHVCYWDKNVFAAIEHHLAPSCVLPDRLYAYLASHRELCDDVLELTIDGTKQAAYFQFYTKLKAMMAWAIAYDHAVYKKREPVSNDTRRDGG